jgi:hypothetical protein
MKPFLIVFASLSFLSIQSASAQSSWLKVSQGTFGDIKESRMMTSKSTSGELDILLLSRKHTIAENPMQWDKYELSSELYGDATPVCYGLYSKADGGNGIAICTLPGVKKSSCSSVTAQECIDDMSIKMLKEKVYGKNKSRNSNPYAPEIEPSYVNTSIPDHSVIFPGTGSSDNSVSSGARLGI